MFAARKARNAFKDGQATYSEIARYGCFEGGGSYPRSVCLSTMGSANPHPPGSKLHTEWENGWRQQAGLRRGTESTGPK